LLVGKSVVCWMRNVSFSNFSFFFKD
jgi:hypothetical protein